MKFSFLPRAAHFTIIYQRRVRYDYYTKIFKNIFWYVKNGGKKITGINNKIIMIAELLLATLLS